MDDAEAQGLIQDYTDRLADLEEDKSVTLEEPWLLHRLANYQWTKGGAGSGNFGHDGRPGQVGGSGGGGLGANPLETHAGLKAAYQSVLKHTSYTPEQLAGALPAHAPPTKGDLAKVRARVEGSIYLGKTEIPNAVLHVLDQHDKAAASAFIKGIGKGDVAALTKDLETVPLYDLHVLSGAEAKSHPLPGIANCNMQSRYITMGQGASTGTFRHELGHAVRSALGGADGYKGRTQISKAVAKEYDKVMERVKADPQGKQVKMDHEWYEKNYGVAGRRGIDNWEENFAEHYRLYHREVYRDREEGGGGKHLAQYRQRHPEMARIFDAHYTAALIGHELSKKGS